MEKISLQFSRFERDRRERRERRASGSVPHSANVAAVGRDSDEDRSTKRGQYRFEDLFHATNAFSEQNRLGEGAFSIVYRGRLPDGTIVAVKRMKSKMLTEEVLKEFESEIEVLSGLHHKNLVSLLGFCVDGNERILIYECMERGTLRDHILEHRECNLQPLSWHHRLLLALDVARAMEYLHSLGKRRVIHRDLKPSNILLDKNMRAKVADFGLLKVITEGQSWAQTVHIKGTMGYIAPESMLDPENVTPAMDVYGFGVILEVLITGKRSKVRINDDVWALVDLFRDMTKSEGAFLEGIDETLKVTTDCTSDWFQSICRVGTLALHCTARDPKTRPPMGHIVQVLAQFVEKWERPSLSEAEGAEDDLQRWRQMLEQGDTTAELLRTESNKPLIQFSGFTHTAPNSGSEEIPSTTGNKWQMPEITLMDEVGNGQVYPPSFPATADESPLIQFSGFTHSAPNSLEFGSTTARQWQMPEMTLVDGHARPTSCPDMAQSRIPTSHSWPGHPQEVTTQFAAGERAPYGVSGCSINPYTGDIYRPDPLSREGFGNGLYRSAQKLKLGKFFPGLP